MQLLRRPLELLRRRKRTSFWREARAGSRMLRRSVLPSTSSVQYRQFGPLEMEAYWLRFDGNEGVGLSAYVGVEELMRFDCFGVAGHFHLNLQQTRCASGGPIQRLSFCTSNRSGQIEESLHRLRVDLMPTLRCNWRAEIRAASVDAESLATAVAWSTEALRSVAADHAA